MTSQPLGSRLRTFAVEYRAAWLRPLSIGVLLLVSTALAALASQRTLTLGLALILAGGLALLALRWPPVGLLAIALAGMFLGYRGPGGLNASILLAALMMGLWLFDMVVRQREVRLAPSRAIWPALGLIVSAMLSFAVGQLRWFSFAQPAPLDAQLGGLAVFVFSAGVLVMAASQLRDAAWLRRLTWAFLAVGSLFVLAKIVLPLVGFTGLAGLPAAGSGFYTWMVALAFGQAVFNRRLPAAGRIVLAALAIAVLVLLIRLKFVDRSGWLPALVCLGVILAFRSWRAALLTTAAAALAAFYLVPELLANEAYSVSTRLEAWEIVGRITATSPIWGLGFANYYWYTPLFPIRGYPVSFNSHNNYVDIVAQTGLVGLVFFLWLLAVLGWQGWRLRHRVPAGFAQAYAYGALGGLAGTLVAAMLGDWALPFVYNIGLDGFRSSVLMWLFLGGLASLEQPATQPFRLPRT